MPLFSLVGKKALVAATNLASSSSSWTCVTKIHKFRTVWLTDTDTDTDTAQTEEGFPANELEAPHFLALLSFASIELPPSNATCSASTSYYSQ